ncbi:MAG: 5-bromo-4-chloroindolyl phosphate hydrolysis family protein [Erysipelotrichaceae bacterium]|nr:5-bromo-4-chloroindolyl phosphate hydrolysis family protein [Erysipelotrichaceae bacterium]
MYRRRGSGFPGGLFIFFFIFGIGGLFEGLISLLPIIITGLVIYNLVNSFNRKSARKDYYKSQSSVRYNSEEKSVNIGISNADMNKIDKKLNEYFKSNLSLAIVDGISLTTKSGKFTTVDQLYLSYGDEKIIKLADFKKKYGDVYKRIMDLLLVFAKKSDINLSTVEVKQQKKEEVKAKRTEVLSDADKYINKIDALNKAIPQEEITNGLYQTCDLLKQIDILKETSQDNSKIDKLYTYYLPILTDVLEKYKKLQDAPVHGEDFKTCEEQLIKTIVLINEALKTICSNMQEDDYMHINADINTLQSLLQKDGFGTNPFGGDKK